MVSRFDFIITSGKTVETIGSLESFPNLEYTAARLIEPQLMDQPGYLLNFWPVP